MRRGECGEVVRSAAAEALRDQRALGGKDLRLRHPVALAVERPLVEEREGDLAVVRPLRDARERGPVDRAPVDAALDAGRKGDLALGQGIVELRPEERRRVAEVAASPEVHTR